MMLGVVKGTALSGERVVLDVQIGEARYREVILLHPLGVRIRVAIGDRVLVGQIEENTDALFALPITLSREVEPAIDIVGDEVLVRSSGGTAVSLATKEDVERVRDELVGHLHLSAAPGAPTGPALDSSQVPITVITVPIDGTTVLKGE
jgi:hypothetical protein